MVAKSLRKNHLNILQVDVWLGLYGLFRRQREMWTVLYYLFGLECLRIDLCGTKFKLFLVKQGPHLTSVCTYVQRIS